MMTLNSDELTGTKFTLNLCSKELEKAAGIPWRFDGMNEKRTVIEKVGLVELNQYYKTHQSILSSSLKDELRLVGKDARLFRPQDVSSWLEAIKLFHNQNEYIARCQAPCFLRFVTPGLDITHAFSRLREFGGNMYAADGSQWDAHYPLVMAALICRWRIDCGANPRRVRRYYSMMYNGFTAVLGHILHLVGQPSGHFLTSVDNALCHVCFFLIHAHRHNMSLECFLRNVLFFCCGDDLVWSDKSGLFTPMLLAETYISFGMSLEFESLDPSPLENLSFVGVNPCILEENGLKVWLYSLKPGRVAPKMFFSRKNRSTLDTIAKLSSLCQLTFADKPLYDTIYGALQRVIGDGIARGELSFNDARVSGCLRAAGRHELFTKYLQLE